MLVDCCGIGWVKPLNTELTLFLPRYLAFGLSVLWMMLLVGVLWMTKHLESVLT